MPCLLDAPACRVAYPLELRACSATLNSSSRVKTPPPPLGLEGPLPLPRLTQRDLTLNSRLDVITKATVRGSAQTKALAKAKNACHASHASDTERLSESPPPLPD
jgi:hypothetical protein